MFHCIEGFFYFLGQFELSIILCVQLNSDYLFIPNRENKVLKKDVRY